VAKYNVTINNILPGSFDTDRLRGGAGRNLPAGKTIDDVMAERRAEETSGRFGNPQEFGMVCAFLCGADAGYLTRQNILLDGGSYPGTF
jgi:3-oxoacyl-[acyl-carrier protein] reductase